MKTFAVCVVALLLFVSIEAKPSTSDCQWGPSYWCQSKSTAKLCGKESYCLTKVWKTVLDENVSVQRFHLPGKCDICKMVAKGLEHLILSNTVEDVAKDEIEKVCHKLDPLSSECKNFIDKYFSKIWSLLQQQVSADDVCHMINMCSSDSVTSQSALLKSPTDAACTVCQFVAGFLKNFIDNNKTEAEAEAEVKKFCSDLGGFKSTCDTLVNNSFDMIWQLLMKAVTPDEICDTIGLCNTSKQIDFAMMAKEPQQVLCELCKEIEPFIKPYLDSNSTKADVKSALEEVCMIIPDNYSSECQSYVDDYFDILWEVLEEAIDNGELCTMIGVCNSTSLTAPKSIIPKDVECGLCKIADQILAGYVNKDSTKDKVEKVLGEVCAILPSTFSKRCNALMTDFFPQLWDFITQEIESGDLCSLISLCSSSAVVSPVQALEKTSHPEEAKVSGLNPLCTLCELLVKKLESMLDTNATEKDIEAALDKVCGLLPSSVRSDCNEMVNKYSGVIIKEILESAGSRLVCTVIHACLTTTMNEVTVDAVQLGIGKCEVCKVVLQGAKMLMEHEQKPLDEALKSACAFVPSSIRSECTIFVEDFAPELLKIITDEINPQEDCKLIKLCSQSVLMNPWVKLVRAQ